MAAAHAGKTGPWAPRARAVRLADHCPARRLRASLTHPGHCPHSAPTPDFRARARVRAPPGRKEQGVGSAGWGGVWPTSQTNPGLLSAAPAAPVAAPPPSARRGLRVRPGDSRQWRGRWHLALGPAARIGGEGPGGARGVGGERGSGRGGGAVHAGRAGEAAESRRRARAGQRGPRPRGDSGLREGLMEVALKGRHRFEEVARGRPPGPAPPRAAAVRISARQVSVLASCRAAHRGRHGRGQMVGAAWPAGSSSPRAAGGTPPAARGPAAALSEERARGCPAG